MRTNLCSEMRCPDCHNIGDFIEHRFGKVSCGGCGKLFHKWAAGAIKLEAHQVMYALELEESRVSYPVHDIMMFAEVFMMPHDIIIDDRGYHLENCMVDYWNTELTEIYSPSALRR